MENSSSHPVRRANNSTNDVVVEVTNVESNEVVQIDNLQGKVLVIRGCLPAEADNHVLSKSFFVEFAWRRFLQTMPELASQERQDDWCKELADCYFDSDDLCLSFPGFRERTKALAGQEGVQRFAPQLGISGREFDREVKDTWQSIVAHDEWLTYLRRTGHRIGFIRVPMICIAGNAECRFEGIKLHGTRDGDKALLAQDESKLTVKGYGSRIYTTICACIGNHSFGGRFWSVQLYRCSPKSWGCHILLQLQHTNSQTSHCRPVWYL